MNQTPALLRKLIVILWISLGLCMIAMIAIESPMIEEMNNYIDEQGRGYGGPIMGLLYLGLFAYVIASLGLFTLQPWAKPAFIWTNAVLLLLDAATGSITVSHSLSTAFAATFNILTGMIVGILLFSPIGHNWESVRSWRQ
jgi:hypothetical protein